MNKRFLSVLGFALVISGLATVVVYRLIVRRFVSAAKPSSTQVIVAARNLELGTLVKDSDLTLAAWPGRPLPSTMFRKEDIVGRGVVSEIYQGEPILDLRLAPKGAGAGLAALIPAGMRAVAVRVNDFVGVAGFVTPGNRVDVLISGLPPGNGQPALGTQTRTLLQDLRVLSAGQKIQKDGEGKPVSVPVVNLLVTPEQAEILSLAGNDTKIQLVLRNPLDSQQAKPPGTALARLFGSAPAPPKEPPAPKPKAVKPAPPPAPVIVPPPAPLIVEVFTGSKRAETKFERVTEVER